MDNLSGKANYYHEKKVSKKQVEVVETVKTELDPKAVEEFINDYYALTKKCEELYKSKTNKHVGDIYITLLSLKTQINRI